MCQYPFGMRTEATQTWRARLGAGVVDLVGPWVLTLPITALGLVSGNGTGEWLAIGLAALVNLPLELRTGQSAGKWLAGLRLAGADGQPLTAGAVLRRFGWRWAPLMVNALLLGPLWVPMAAWAAMALPSVVDREGRAVHDLLSGTIVTGAPSSALIRAETPVRGVAVMPGWGAASILGRRRP